MKLDIDGDPEKRECFVHLVPETKQEAVMVALLKETMWVSEGVLAYHKYVGTKPDYSPDVDTEYVMKLTEVKE